MFPDSVHQGVMKYICSVNVNNVLVCPSQEMCTVEEPNEEFTSRHSLEWKFLFLDHRYDRYFNVSS